MKVFLTGGTGFIGSHVANVLHSRGHEIVALARPTSDTAHLESLGATIARGDVTDPASLEAAAAGCDIVIHAAAVVGPVGKWEHFEAVGVQGTANVIRAAQSAGIRRFIHVGSIAVYGSRPGGRTYSESTPFDYTPEGWNHYVREKVRSEQALWEAHGYQRIAATSMRPSIVIGPGDRNFLPRAIDVVNFRFARITGSGNNYIAFVVVEEVADAIVRAAEREETAGQAYNLSGTPRITQRQLFNTMTDLLGKPPITGTMSFNMAMRSAGLLEGWWRLARRPGEPPVTRFGVALVGQQFQVDTTRAREQLGWEGNASYEDALRRSLEWHRANVTSAV
jgi:2-alkyl-3-oxoalkanoate reductase